MSLSLGCIAGHALSNVAFARVIVVNLFCTKLLEFKDLLPGFITGGEGPVHASSLSVQELRVSLDYREVFSCVGFTTGHSLCHLRLKKYY